jgi:uncharacterized protein (TIGR03083 family)
MSTSQPAALAQRYGLVAEFDPVDTMERDALALADAAQVDMRAPIVGCPGWDASDVVFHVLEVHDFWGQLVRDRLDSYEQAMPVYRPVGDDVLLRRYRDGVHRFARILREADPTAPTWTWSAQQDAAFVVRHQVQEAAVHRWDVETATGRTWAIDADAAADGVEEFLTHSTAARVAGAAPVGGDVALVTSDRDLGWLVTEDEAGEVTRRRLRPQEEPLGAVASVRGTASDLLLLLYRRRKAADLDVTGDPAAVDRLAARSGTD